MPSFVVLGKYTEQGMTNIAGLPDRLAAVKQAAQDAGGRMIFYYFTMGDYDFSVLEAPDAETVTRLLLQTEMQGNVRTTTMRAFTEEEAASLVGSLA